jgi:outer membrane protein OmpA-like peptidoglycan-associated protein
MLFAFLLLGFFPALGAEEFFYIHIPGDKYRILSIVNEDVYIDRRLSHHSSILNRIAVEITGLERLPGSRSSAGRHRAVFVTAEEAQTADGREFLEWGEDYETDFIRDRWGNYRIDRNYFMPVVRNVPIFPNQTLNPGDSWEAEGEEAHDFRDSFGIPDPYRIPFSAHYTYVGQRSFRGRSYPAFLVSYRIYTEPERVEGSVWPLRILGAADQIIYWDREVGHEAAYTEDFRMIFDLSNGRTVEFRGSAEAEVLEAQVMDREAMVADIGRTIEDLGLVDTTVRPSAEGVVISLEDIQFTPDSADLLPDERQKIDALGELLRRYPDRDILVAGHTALAGSEAGRLSLSQERAGVVADYLIRQGIRSPDRVIVRGYGADRPIADNDTPEGMRRNRRVEIILLEN